MSCFFIVLNSLPITFSTVESGIDLERLRVLGVESSAKEEFPEVTEVTEVTFF